jgi:hypothetical protein
LAKRQILAEHDAESSDATSEGDAGQDLQKAAAPGRQPGVQNDERDESAPRW